MQLNYEQLTEHELLDRLKTKDQQAFSEIYTRYWDKLFFLASKKTRNMEDAEEIVQDIFVYLWNNSHKLSIHQSLNSYLAVAVKYKVIKQLDKYHQQEKYAQLAPKDSSDNSTEDWLEFEELKGQLARLIKTLPNKCQLVYTMSRDKGYSQKKISKTLKISEKTVEAHISKALRYLRTKLGRYSVFL